jgi:hypothetical protein
MEALKEKSSFIGFQVRAAADAQLIEDNTLRVNLAVSHLKDGAQRWAYSLLLHDPNHFV